LDDEHLMKIKNSSNVFYDFQATAREDRYCWELEL